VIKKRKRTLGYISIVVILILTAIPFRGFRHPEIDLHSPISDIVENILLYTPLGYAFGDLGLLVVVSRSAALSLLIESAQAFYQDRFSQPSDVISNTAGAALGVLLYRSLVRKNLAG
jgi:glycopeptide antibiotics resistance protein